ncbi:MAG: valine--tRNA ligase [Alphaproteobacteria bacterium]|nr:valine--tRNA ligase [Alphaproteobacteria bacterium]
MLEKTFEPQSIENKIYKAWEDSGTFSCTPSSPKKPYTIMMPPPNVTGNLHVGHALTYTLQDILVRYKRMQGFDVLWQPGTDHAGIATQFVVERQLAEEGVKRQDIGRDAFVEKVWQWKNESGNAIVSQQRRLGISPDWMRQRFTLDEGLSNAVLKVFVNLYKEGLIYKDKRLVNWDPKMQTAVSDLEVISQETKGHLWYIRYAFVDDSENCIVVATTRPETLLGDVAVAVHPEDERFKHLIGKHVHLPLTEKTIPIIGDEYCDPEKGSGAVKITPAHDFNDFEVGRRHDLPLINILDKSACLNEAVPIAYQGLSVEKARSQIISDLEAGGLIEKIEPNTHAVPYGEKSGVQIQPWLTDQWFVDAKTLAEPALKAVEDGRTKFLPDHCTAVYFEWLRNIQPWCISRQIWWGHQVPAWYGPDGHVFVEESEEQAHLAAVSYYGEAVELTRDTDVLDTWFSSALWPFSTLGWPDQTLELKRYYPTDVLDTGFDIIFFWVARMMMMGLHLMKDVPFRTVYIHGMVRDEKGAKMSKTKGNVIDPLTYMDKFGTDALRFSLSALAVPGRDLKLGESRIESSRNFMTKIWNAARFLQMNNCEYHPHFDPKTCQHTLNRWIVGHIHLLSTQVTKALESYRFDEAASHIYQFVWGTYCDYYLEFLKPVFNDENLAKEARLAATWAFTEVLKIAHPLIPFITEVLWHEFTGASSGLLMNQPWPTFQADMVDPNAHQEMDWIVDTIVGIRSRRAEFNVPPGSHVPMQVYEATPEIQERVSRHDAILKRLGRIDTIEVHPQKPPTIKEAALFIVNNTPIVLPLGNIIDVKAEVQRLQQELGKIGQEIESCQKRLSNSDFMEKAKPEIIEEMQERLESFGVRKTKIQEALQLLQGT